MQWTLTSKAAEPLLDIRDLRIDIWSRYAKVTAVDGVSLFVHPGEVVGLVGESGCGKSLTAQAVMDLLTPPARQTGGQIVFAGENLEKLPPSVRGRRRGKSISMVFQEPLSALNPVFTVGTQIADILKRHTGLTGGEITDRIIGLLEHVGIADPKRVAGAYPHELSGGMRQRALIAMAISCRPKLVIADEPTTALDATVQAQIIELLKRLVAEDGISLLLISHDLSIISEICDRVYVMYAGKVVERAATADLFARPRHPYSSALLRCVPALKDKDAPLQTIEGTVPMLTELPSGCRFAPRCAYAREPCRRATTPMVDFGSGHEALCIRAPELTLPGIEGMAEAAP